MTSELQIHSIAAVTPQPDGRHIVLKADAVVAQQPTQLEIAITTELAPSMALALLSSTAKARSERDELSPAFDAMAAAVVRSSSPEKVRIQLLFNHGAVLPVEMSADAARSFSEGLVEYFGAAQRQFARRRTPNLVGED